MLFANFNNVSIIYHSFAVGRGFRRLIFFATFKNVSVIYQSFAVGSGVQEAHGVCHFQYCFSHLPHMCYRKGGSGCSCLLPLFQYCFNPLPHVCCSHCIQKAHVLSHFQYSISYHTFAVVRGVQGSHGLCHFQYCLSHLPHLRYRQGVEEAHVLCHFQ